MVLVDGGGAKREIERSSGSGSAVVVCGEGLDGPGGAVGWSLAEVGSGGGGVGVAMVEGAICGR